MAMHLSRYPSPIPPAPEAGIYKRPFFRFDTISHPSFQSTSTPANTSCNYLNVEATLNILLVSYSIPIFLTN